MRSDLGARARELLKTLKSNAWVFLKCCTGHSLQIINLFDCNWGLPSYFKKYRIFHKISKFLGVCRLLGWKFQLSVRRNWKLRESAIKTLSLRASISKSSITLK